MATLIECATLVLHALTVQECNDLSLVSSQIFSGPPCTKLSRTVHNKLGPKRSTGLGIRDFIGQICFINPNLHYFHLDDMNITTLALKWTYPNVRSSSRAKPLRLDILAPNLCTLVIEEDGPADHCLSVFEGLHLPARVRHLDFSGIHVSDKDFSHLIALAKDRKVTFCSCCQELFSAWEDKWSIRSCPFQQHIKERSDENQEH